MKTISKTELAKRFGVVPSMITKYISRGMPVTGSGRVNWPVAQEWRKKFVEPSRSGSFNARQRHAQAAHSRDPLPDSLSDELLGTPPAASYRILFDRILSHRHLVPEILAAIGVEDAALLYFSDDLFAALVVGLAGALADGAYLWETDDIPKVQTDIAAIFKKYGLELTSEVAGQADRMADAAFTAIERMAQR